MNSTIKMFNEIDGIRKKLNEELIAKFNLVRVQAPTILNLRDGIDNDASGLERSVTFDARETREVYKVMQSAAKWKRLALHKYEFPMGQGLLTETVGIRRDAKMSQISSLLWDELSYEYEIKDEDRNSDYVIDQTIELYKIISSIIKAARKITLPKTPKVYTPQELEEKYPSKTPKQREEIVAKDEGAFILLGLGHKLDSGIRHSVRPFDTEDWNLNAEIIIWHDTTESAISVAATAVSVNRVVLKEQAYLAKEEDRLSLPFHTAVLNDVYPSSFGGSIFESRLWLIALDKKHIGQVQVSVWPKDLKEEGIL